MHGALEDSLMEVEGVEGIMDAYSHDLDTVAPSGQTLFSPVIHRAAEIASQSLLHDNRKYYVLLIITDGVHTDIEETMETLVKASDLPLSILIVGVGRNVSYTQMEVLDADTGPRLKCSTGQVAARDTVHFVKFVPILSDHSSCDKGSCLECIFGIFRPARDSETVLQGLMEELPVQFLTYMHNKGIKPHEIHTPQPSI